MISTTYILVGDGSHARLFETDEPTMPWRLVSKFDRAHSREKLDRPDTHEDRDEHAFARQLAANLESLRERGTLARLVVAAPAKFLGQLRGEMAHPLASLVVASVDKDFTHVADGSIHEHIHVPLG